MALRNTRRTGMTEEELLQRVRKLEDTLAAHLDQQHVDPLRIPEHMHEHVHIHGHMIDDVVGLEEKVGPPSAAALEKEAALQAKAEKFWGRREPTMAPEFVDDDEVRRQVVDRAETDEPDGAAPYGPEA